MTRSEVDQTLADIGPHAEQQPLHFASNQEDAAVLESPDEVELLLRDAIGNSFGHNMGCPDCGDKAIKAYQRLLQLQPEKAFANWRYGAFLAQTAQQAKSIPYLQKAENLGIVDAHYTAAMVYISSNDQDRAKFELRQYVQANPKDKKAKGLLADMEHGNLHIQVHDGPPSEAAPAPTRP
jgi:tetratricopeptide (TPR) repeat protein